MVTAVSVAHLKVHNVANLVHPQEGGQVLGAVCLEGTREHVARAAPQTLRVCHLGGLSVGGRK